MIHKIVPMVAWIRSVVLSSVLAGALVSCHSHHTLPVNEAKQSPPLNQRVLQAIEEMPRGGKYRLSSQVLQQMRKAVGTKHNQLRIQANRAKPSFCSSATYLVLLKVLESCQREGILQLSPNAMSHLIRVGQPDGVGVWGRWNANGPGTARLFKELRCGTNFTSYEAARAGDFMKIWWNDTIGAKERGHSVVFLGLEQHHGVDMVRFWSSNTPNGYGVKVVPRSTIKRALFSRLEHLRPWAHIDKLPREDSFLEKMLTHSYRWRSVKWKCSVRTTP